MLSCKSLAGTPERTFASMVHVVNSKVFQMVTTKVPILKEVNFGKVKLWDVEHFWTLFVFILGVIAEYSSNHAQK